MIPTIYEDALARPDLFHWFGILEPEFDEWLKALPLRVHPGLVSFWRRTGGGDLFESETIFGPLAAKENDNVLMVNQFHWDKGLPRDMLIFHSGICFSASFVDFRRHRNRILELKEGSYDIRRWFGTLGDWYRMTIRSEFAGRYGLISEKEVSFPQADGLFVERRKRPDRKALRKILSRAGDRRPGTGNTLR